MAYVFLRTGLLLLLLPGLLSLGGCVAYKVPSTAFVQEPPPRRPGDTENANAGPEVIARREKALNHWWYKVVPRHRSQIRWWDVPHWFSWALLGNDDDGAFGEEPTARYKTQRKIGFRRAMDWFFRNPFHNLFFYGIGTAHRDNSEFTLLRIGDKGNSEILKYRKKGKHVFAGEDYGLYLGFHGWKPFISLRFRHARLLQVYAGWRERGNFGTKFHLWATPRSEKRAQREPPLKPEEEQA